MKQDKPPIRGGFSYLKQSEAPLVSKIRDHKKRSYIMAFGPPMRLKVPQKDGAALTVELAPLTRETMGRFIENGGMQHFSVIRYLGHRTSPVLEDEYEWFEKARTSKDSIVWGVWIIKGSRRILIGSSALSQIEHGPTGMKQATSGVLIFDQAYWGKGIASSIHKARTWFAFTQAGLTRIKSAVIQANPASRFALEKSGYTLVFTERNMNFTDGALLHQDNLECLNPLEPFWSNWWGNDIPHDAALAAKERTNAALRWAETYVALL